jgi:hypothetical protein
VAIASSISSLLNRGGPPAAGDVADPGPDVATEPGGAADADCDPSPGLGERSEPHDEARSHATTHTTADFLARTPMNIDAS